MTSTGHPSFAVASAASGSASTLTLASNARNSAPSPERRGLPKRLAWMASPSARYGLRALRFSLMDAG